MTSIELDEAPISSFHVKTLVASGLGFLTDAYDLFIIGTVAVLLKGQWHLGTSAVSIVSSATLLGAFFGAMAFGRLADILGRRRIYRLVAAVMVLGAVCSAFSPNLTVLVTARFVLGLGVGGDYPVSAVLMSEFANRHQRGRLVSLLFSMQAVGLVLGPVVGMTLLAGDVRPSIAWRLMLGLGALPAAAAIYARHKIPESPRFAELQAGRAEHRLFEPESLGPTTADTSTEDVSLPHFGLRDFLSNRRLLLTLVATAGTWFAFDYAYYGNTISTPLVLKAVAPHASLLAKLAWTLIVFVVAAIPGYVLAFVMMDRVGHKRLQLVGFLVMALSFLLIGLVPGIASTVGLFLFLYGLSYFFAEFGPNTTTFVLPGELFPTRLRTTGHGISAGIAKLGAFVGVFAIPVLLDAIGLRATLLISALAAVVGVLLTLLLPEPSGKSLEELNGEHERAVKGETSSQKALVGSDRLDLLAHSIDQGQERPA